MSPNGQFFLAGAVLSTRGVQNQFPISAMSIGGKAPKPHQTMKNPNHKKAQGAVGVGSGALLDGIMLNSTEQKEAIVAALQQKRSSGYNRPQHGESLSQRVVRWLKHPQLPSQDEPCSHPTRRLLPVSKTLSSRTMTRAALSMRGAQKQFPIGISWLMGLLFALPLTVPVIAQGNVDSIKVDPAHHKVVFENDQVRVVRWVIPVGDKTLMHSHPESLIIDLTDYNGRVTMGDGKISEVQAKAGSVSWRPALTHAVENTGRQPMEGLIVEPKKSAWAQAAGGKDNLDSIKVDPAHHKVVFENDQVRVVRWVIPVGDKTLMHSHPESLIADLTDYNGRVTMGDGKISEVQAKAGSVSWRPALTHAVENIGSQPMEGLILEPKKPASKASAPQ